MSIFGKEARILLCRSLWWTMMQSQLSHQLEISMKSFVHNVDLNCRAMFKRPQFHDKYQGDRATWYGFIQESHLKLWLQSLLLALSNQNKVFEPCYICMFLSFHTKCTKGNTLPTLIIQMSVFYYSEVGNAMTI